MPRHLVGIASPPNDHHPDPLVSGGPGVPAGWESESWCREDGAVKSYWLRAWNKSTGQIAYASGDKYKETADALRKRIAEGGDERATVTVTEIR